MQVLKLSLKKAPFDVMVTGEKKVEFREQSAYIKSRFVDSKTGKDKEYDFVEFTNGYGYDKPRFTVTFKGYKLVKEGVHKTYSNGLEVDTRGQATYVISLGDDIVRTNC